MQGETKVHLKDHRRVDEQKTFHCSQCDFKTQFKTCLARHNMVHSGEKSFVGTPNGCTVSSAYAVNLVPHQLVHSNLKPFKCNLCGKCVGNNSHLNCHIRSHTGEKPYKCLFKDCDYSSTQAGNLQRHFRRHTGEKPYKCLFKDCDYSATNAGILQRHFRRHTDEKPCKCLFKDCDYSSTNAGTLQRHFRRHTDEKPYKCLFKDCDYFSTDAGNLQRHFRRHTGEKPYKCLFKDCNYSSTNAGNLQRHFRRHTGKKPYRCSHEVCEYSSARASNLKLHMMTHKDGKVQTGSFKNSKYSSIHASGLKKRTNRVHIRNKLYACQSCEYRSETAVELKRHIVNNHQKAQRTFISLPRLNSSSSSSLIEIESTKTVSISKLISRPEANENPKLIVRTFAFVGLTRLKFDNCSYKKDIPTTNKTNLEASLDPIQKTKSRPCNSASAVGDPKLRIPTVVVLERLQVNYDSDDDFIPDISGGPVDLNVPTASDYPEINTEQQLLQAGPKLKPQKAYLYSCKICDYETKEVKQYKSHLQSHREQRQFFCPLCDFVCCKIKLVKSHFRTHDNDSSASDSDRCNDTQISHHARVSIASKEAPFNNTSV